MDSWTIENRHGVYFRFSAIVTDERPKLLKKEYPKSTKGFPMVS